MFEKIRKGFFIAAGFLFLGLGAVGMFLPVLPTTPFLLLAAACFFRGSERMYARLLRHPWFGQTIRDYRERRAVSKQAKIVSIAALWTVIGISALFAVSALWHRLILFAVAAGVTAFLVSLKTAMPGRTGEDPMRKKYGDEQPTRREVRAEKGKPR